MALQTQIEDKLQQALRPTHLMVENESHGHNVAPGSETHFKVVIASPQFDGMNAVQRHRAVYGVLAEEMKTGVHALALHTYTPSEWSEVANAPASPACMGGAKK